jgi:hypothetical protein
MATKIIKEIVHKIPNSDIFNLYATIEDGKLKEIDNFSDRDTFYPTTKEAIEAYIAFLEEVKRNLD